MVAALDVTEDTVIFWPDNGSVKLRPEVTLAVLKSLVYCVGSSGGGVPSPGVASRRCDEYSVCVSVVVTCSVTPLTAASVPAYVSNVPQGRRNSSHSALPSGRGIWIACVCAVSIASDGFSV